MHNCNPKQNKMYNINDNKYTKMIFSVKLLGGRPHVINPMVSLSYLISGVSLIQVEGHVLPGSNCFADVRSITYPLTADHVVKYNLREYAPS